MCCKLSSVSVSSNLDHRYGYDHIGVIVEWMMFCRDVYVGQHCSGNSPFYHQRIPSTDVSDITQHPQIQYHIIGFGRRLYDIRKVYAKFHTFLFHTSILNSFHRNTIMHSINPYILLIKYISVASLIMFFHHLSYSSKDVFLRECNHFTIVTRINTY